VISLPALRAVRGAYPHAELSILIKQELASFFDGMTWVDRVMPYRIRAGLAGLADRWRVIAAIRAVGFDLAVLFPASFEAALWTAAAGVPVRAGFASDARGWLLTRRAKRRPELESRHQAHDYLAMLGETLDIEGAAENLGIEADEGNRERMRRWLDAKRRRPGAPLFAVAAAAAYGPAKEWPAERYGALIDELAERHGAECVLVGAPAERAKCEAIAAGVRSGALVAAGETTIGELAALLSLSAGFAGNDSGAMHLAGALGIPTVGVFGSTNPARTGPLGPRTAILYDRIECSPCLDRTCRFGHYQCLKRISPDHVIGALARLGAIAG